MHNVEERYNSTPFVIVSFLIIGLFTVAITGLGLPRMGGPHSSLPWEHPQSKAPFWITLLFGG